LQLFQGYLYFPSAGRDYLPMVVAETWYYQMYTILVLTMYIYRGKGYSVPGHRW
jgi:hypothetical protein